MKNTTFRAEVLCGTAPLKLLEVFLNPPTWSSKSLEAATLSTTWKTPSQLSTSDTHLSCRFSPSQFLTTLPFLQSSALFVAMLVGSKFSLALAVAAVAESPYSLSIFKQFFLMAPVLCQPGG